MARDPAFHTVTTIASADPQTIALQAPSDALSNPDNDDLIVAGLAFWPTGAAWGSPDGQAVDLGSNLARFTRVLLNPFEWLYGLAFQLAREATVSGVVDLLAEWELDYGLPDNCVDEVSSTAERLRALEAKVNSQAVVHPSDFIRVAWSYGFDIEIEEPAIFECGFSECGGEHETGSVREEAYWVIRVRDMAVDYFLTGISELGRDPLFSFGEAERLLCIMRRLAPAWTIPVLWSSREYFYLADGGDAPLTNDAGQRFLLVS